MKKFLTFFAILALGTSLSFAQTTPGTTNKKTAPKVDAKAAEKQGTPKGGAATPGPTKKDGTPDMRYKENKEAKPAPGPTKKDGTPDMRYKANKDAKAKEAKPAASPK